MKRLFYIPLALLLFGCQQSGATFDSALSGLHDGDDYISDAPLPSSEISSYVSNELGDRIEHVSYTHPDDTYHIHTASGENYSLTTNGSSFTLLDSDGYSL